MGLKAFTNANDRQAAEGHSSGHLSPEHRSDGIPVRVFMIGQKGLA
jgi:hypothetical protein